ncbi:hypothetical protein DEI92_00050 [Curtobacterium sp. MCBD17_034]|nr:hypothetical protein DEI86_09010 [Curtobacterium sp. MCBD17_028]PZF61966.1 hypothetical protein DEI92_00050 [Curtobacterium sp. MCBD17_034]PZM34100.1 hypothetical protein DEI90_10650 [Curtobacterium sp. MCBD17_031]
MPLDDREFVFDIEWNERGDATRRVASSVGPKSGRTVQARWGNGGSGRATHEGEFVSGLSERPMQGKLRHQMP